MIPAGILTFIFLDFLTVPFPLQLLHGSLIVFPSPPHLLHVVCVAIVPKKVCLTLLWKPAPLQASQLTSFEFLPLPVPLHEWQASILSTSISFSVPKAASSNEMLTCFNMSVPLLCLLPCFPKAAPKISENGLLPNPKSEKISSKSNSMFEKSPALKPPKPENLSASCPN